jgi:hypothetical protein
MSRPAIPPGTRIFPHLVPGTGIILEALDYPEGYRAVNICRVGGSEFITVGPTELRFIADFVVRNGVPNVPAHMRSRQLPQRLECGCAFTDGIFVPCGAHLEIH